MIFFFLNERVWAGSNAHIRITSLTYLVECGSISKKVYHQDTLGYAGVTNDPKSQGLTSSLLTLDVHCGIPGTSVDRGYSGIQAERTAINSNGTKC